MNAVIHNTCEDSLLAAPLIIDLIVLAELCERVTLQREGESTPHRLHPVLSLLSYLLKAPLVAPGTPVVNSLFRQREAIGNFMRACIGLAPESHMLLEHKMHDAGPSMWSNAVASKAAGAAASSAAASACSSSAMPHDNDEEAKVDA